MKSSGDLVITCFSHHEDIPCTDSTMMDASLVQMVQTRGKTSDKLKQQFLPRNEEMRMYSSNQDFERLPCRGNPPMPCCILRLVVKSSTSQQPLLHAGLPMLHHHQGGGGLLADAQQAHQ